MTVGRELNTRIVAVSTPYLAARRHLEEVMDVEKRLLDRISLDTIERKEGRSARWNIQNVTMRSKVVIERLSDGRQPQVDMKAFGEDLALMGAAVKDIDDFSANHPDASLSTSLSDDLLADVRRLGERLSKARGDLLRIDPVALAMMRTHFNSMLAVIQPPPKIGR